MKRIILSLAVVFAFNFANAQDLTSSKGEPYLPQAGDWSVGFNATSALEYIGNAFNGNTGNKGANLFGANSAIPYVNGGFSFVGKKFTEDNKATRYIGHLNVNVGSEKVGNADSKTTTSFGLVGGIGKEWRKGSTRLQGFYGADVFAGFGIPGESQFSFIVGAQGFVGAEYFVFPKVSLGAQYAYGVNIGLVSKGEIKDDAGNVTHPKSSNFGLNIGSASGIGTASVLFNVYF